MGNVILKIELKIFKSFFYFLMFKSNHLFIDNSVKYKSLTFPLTMSLLLSTISLKASLTFGLILIVQSIVLYFGFLGSEIYGNIDGW